MSKLQVFKNELFQVSAMLENGQTIFDAETVARSLGLMQVKNGVEYVRWERVNEYLKVSPQVGKGDFIPEPAVYKLAFKASNEVAEKFQDWLAVEVLPEIRKTGGYIPSSENDSDEDIMAKAFLIANKKIELLTLGNKQKDKVIGELKPKADYTDNILKNTGLVTITQISKDYGMSGTKMNELLHDLGVQYKQSNQWLLYTKHHDKGYTHSETIPITRSDGRKDISMLTKWTQKGRLFLYELLKVNGVIPIIETKEVS